MGGYSAILGKGGDFRNWAMGPLADFTVGLGTVMAPLADVFKTGSLLWALKV